MLTKTRGIVFRTVKYSDTSVIARIYTEAFGLKSYIFRGMRKPGARVRASTLQHLNLLEIITDNREYRGIQNPREVRIEHPYRSLPFDMRKSSVALFINEMLCRSIKHEEPDQSLFDFLRRSLIWFDDVETHAVNFHLWFCIQLTRSLGFFPGRTDETSDFFDLAEGLFQKNMPVHEYFVDAPGSHYLHELIRCGVGNVSGLSIPHAIRVELVDHIINYYKLHIHDFGDIKSCRILAEVLS
jgi:DNA repair protein RecO (recombination protein O)